VAELLSPRVRTDPVGSLPIPKRGGGVRRLALLSARDAEAWDRTGGALAGVVERILRPEVLANRARASSTGGWHLERHEPALVAARRAAAHLMRDAQTVARSDVRSFYGTVRPGTLWRSLVGAGAPRGAARRAAEMLEGWGSAGHPGLPIGPRTSAVLATAVLADADRALGSLPFLRWVDDYLIAAPDERAASLALERLDEALGRLGLARAPEKTRVEDGGRPGTWLGVSTWA